MEGRGFVLTVVCGFMKVKVKVKVFELYLVCVCALGRDKLGSNFYFILYIYIVIVYFIFVVGFRFQNLRPLFSPIRLTNLIQIGIIQPKNLTK